MSRLLFRKTWTASDSAFFSGAHNALVPRLVALLREAKAAEILLVLGGTIPPADIPGLKAQGVAEVFGPGTPLDAIVTFLRENVQPRTARLGFDASSSGNQA